MIRRNGRPVVFRVDPDYRPKPQAEYDPGDLAALDALLAAGVRKPRRSLDELLNPNPAQAATAEVLGDVKTPIESPAAALQRVIARERPEWSWRARWRQ